MSSTGCLDSSSAIMWEKLGNRTEDLALWPSFNPSFPKFFFCGLSKAHAGASPVLVDELDAGNLQGSANGEIIRCSHGRLIIG